MKSNSSVRAAGCVGVAVAAMGLMMSSVSGNDINNELCVSVDNPFMGGYEEDCTSRRYGWCTGGTCYSQITLPEGQICCRCYPFPFANCPRIGPYRCPNVTAVVGTCVGVVGPFNGWCACNYAPGTPSTPIGLGLMTGNCR